MNSEDIRLECLKLSVEQYRAQPNGDVLDMATKFYEFVTGEKDQAHGASVQQVPTG